MKNPFCENSKCNLYKMMVEPSIGRVFLEEDNGERIEILRHVYRNPERVKPAIIHLCGVCHNAVQTVI